MNQWSTIQQCTNKFCGYLSQIESMNQSGMIEETKVHYKEICVNLLIFSNYSKLLIIIYLLIFQLDKARQQYKAFRGSTFPYEHCWNVLKNSLKWLGIIQDHRPKKWIFQTTSSSSNLESINLENEDIPHVPNVLERPQARKLKKND